MPFQSSSCSRRMRLRNSAKSISLSPLRSTALSAIKRLRDALSPRGTMPPSMAATSSYESSLDMSSSNIWKTFRNSFTSSRLKREDLMASRSDSSFFSSASSCTRRIIRRNSRRSICPSLSSSISFSSALARACVCRSLRTSGKSSSMRSAKFLLDTSPTPSGSNLLKKAVNLRTSRSEKPWFARCLFRTCIRCFSIKFAKLQRSKRLPPNEFSSIICMMSFSECTCPTRRKTPRTSFRERAPSLSRSFPAKLLRMARTMSSRKRRTTLMNSARSREPLSSMSKSSRTSCTCSGVSG
mmetsp:Transcript_100191/g.312162  ORF Transcript_100191/g.312162 Transcript_100191/m.312162 type:complete len:297 (-) Transcript_100191:51-941(-)